MQILVLMSGFIPSLIFQKRPEGPEIFREIFFKSPAGMCILTHPDFELKLLNDSFAEIFSLEKSRISGKHFAAVWKKTDKRDEFFSKLIKEGKVSEFILVPDENDLAGREIILSAVFIDAENILITAAARV